MAGKVTSAVPNQNLINPVTLSDIGRPTGFWRSVVLDLLSVLSALFLGYTYFRYLTTGLSPWYALGIFLAFSAFSVLQVFLAKGIGRRVLMILAEAIALVVCFVFYNDWQVVLIAGLAAFVVLLWGYFASRLTVRNQMEVQFFKATRNVLGKVTTAVLLVMVIVYVPQAQGDQIFMPRESFKVLFNWATGFLNNFYPGISLTGSFGDFSQNFARAQLQNNVTFGSLTQSQQNVAIEQAMAELSGAVAKTTGIAPTQSESVSDVAYDYLVSTLVNLRNKFQDQFTLWWIIALFLILRSIGIVFVWIAQIASLVLYEILLAGGFMHIDEATQTKEIVAY